LREFTIAAMVIALASPPPAAAGQNLDQVQQLRELRPVDRIATTEGAAEGVEWLAALLERSPENSYAWFRLGSLAESLGRYGEAATAYRRASDFVPYAVWGLHHSARMEARTGRVEVAVTRLREAFDRGYADHAEIVSDPELSVLRGDAGFERLLQSMMDRRQPQVDLRSSWSPDGEQVVFSSSPTGERSWDLFLVGSDGNGLRRLTSTYHNDLEPSWSPNGEWIAFIRVEALAGGRELYVIRPDGTGFTRLTGSSRPLWGGRKNFPSWAPTSDRRAVTVTGPGAENGIYVLGKDGSAPTRLTDQGAWPNFDRVGAALVYDDGHLWTVPVRGGAPTAIRPDSSLVWWATSMSPSGTVVASSAFPRGGRVNQVAVTDLVGGTVTLITPSTLDAFMPSWSPDGRQLTFAASQNAFGHGGRVLFLVNRDGSGLRPLVNQASRSGTRKTP
jgi:TolB protein